tara:strand:+ start:1650 stop:2651 length:1002 start_codon:yes stop_codon:yes gene_type:complete
MITNKDFIKEQVDFGRTAIENLHVWDVDRSQYMNASEADSCIRRQWYEKHDTEKGPVDWGYARRGSHGEKYLVESLRASNMPLELAGDEQKSFADRETMISATPDGVALLDDGRYQFEFKTVDPRVNRSKLPRSGHVTQLRLGMALLNKLYYRKEPIKAGILIYMDASNFNDITQHIITPEPGILERYAQRAKTILKVRAADTLDREGKATGECKLCPFKQTCGVDFAPRPTQQSRGNRGSALDEFVKNYNSAKEAEDLAKSTKAAAGEAIKQELINRSTTELVVGPYHIVVKTIKGRRSLNRKLIEQAGIDLSPFETEGAPSERLEVKHLAT